MAKCDALVLPWVTQTVHRRGRRVGLGIGGSRGMYGGSGVLHPEERDEFLGDVTARLASVLGIPV